MNAKKHWYKKSLWPLFLGIVVSVIISFFYYMELKESSVKDTKNISTIYAARTETILNSIFHKTDVLAAVVKLQNGQISESTFEDIAKLVYEDNHGIRGIQYMPGAIVTYSYPLEGNEAVMGKNFLEIPERRKDVLLAIDTKSIALSGPYNLLQGGLGVVARNSIFLTDASGKEYFWGFSAIILDLPKAIEAASLRHLANDGYDYQLYCINENDERLVIEGNPELNIEQSVCNEIKVPHHAWTLAIRPGQSWLNEAKAGLVLLFGFLLSLILWQRYRLLVQKETAMQAKDLFFSNISHDMRTPLNAVLGFSSLAQRPGLSGTVKDVYLRKIESSAALLLDLINDTLTISRANLGKLQLNFKPIRAKELAASILEPIRILATEKNISVSYTSSGYEPVCILADQLNTQKLFLNLLNNAVKYTPPNGHIWISVRTTKNASDMLDVEVCIKDDGIGMHEDFLAHIYEPFVQEKRKGYEGLGTGLGLSIVKQLVDLFKGTIRVKSEWNHGTSFTVGLSFQEIEMTPEKSGQSIAIDVSRLSGKKILICEDNALNLEIISEVLKEKGMLIETAENGKLGVDKFLASSPGEYQAILMDIRMPVMDGYAAVRLIRNTMHSDAKNIPIFALTADAFSDDIEKCLQAGMNGCLTKPIDLAKILKALCSTL